MSTYKRCKVVMLPTNKKSNIFLGKITNQLQQLRVADKDNSTNNQNLYILSDEKFAIGDWVINGNISRSNHTIVNLTTQKQVNEFNQIAGIMGEFNEKIKDIVITKKIIATTDNSLSVVNKLPITEGKSWTLLPRPSDSFIRKYCDAYNKGNIITNVIVEYNTGDENLDGYVAMFGGHEIGDTVKVNSKDNTITIKRIKNNWNRKEVIKLCQDAMVLGVKSQRGKGFSFNEAFLDFLEKNGL